MTVADDVRAALADVVDPEIPVLTIEDLGVLRDVAVDGERVVLATHDVRIDGAAAVLPALAGALIR